MPISIINIRSGAKPLGYGKRSYKCDQPIQDSEYVSRSKSNGTSYYHSICALQVRLIEKFELALTENHFRPVERSNRILTRGLRKKLVLEETVEIDALFFVFPSLRSASAQAKSPA